MAGASGRYLVEYDWCNGKKLFC